MAPSSLLQVHTHKGKQDGGQWGIFTNFDIFSTLFFVQHLGPDACSAVRGQQFRAKNIKVTKNIFKHFLELQTFCTVQGHSAVLFQHKSQNKIARKQHRIGAAFLQDYCIVRILIIPTSLYTKINIHTFLFNFMGGLMRIKLQYLLGIQQQITVTLGTLSTVRV